MKNCHILASWGWILAKMATNPAFTLATPIITPTLGSIIGSKGSLHTVEDDCKHPRELSFSFKTLQQRPVTFQQKNSSHLQLHRGMHTYETQKEERNLRQQDLTVIELYKHRSGEGRIARTIDSRPRRISE